MIGRKLRCDCGCVQTPAPTAPRVSPPTVWLDSWAFLGSSVAVLLVSLLVGGSVAAWVALDRGAAESVPVATAPRERAPATTVKESQPPEQKAKETERERSQEKDRERSAEKNEVQPRLLEAPVLRTADNAKPHTYTEKELYERLLHTVAFIGSTDDGERWGLGSGNVIHVARKLIVTNHHVVYSRELRKVRPRVEVLFPRRNERHEVIKAKKDYLDLMFARKGQTARVLLADPKCDLAVIQLEGNLPQETMAVKVAPRVAEENDKVYSVGNPGPSNAVWVPSSGTVRSRVEQIYANKYNKLREPTGEKYLFLGAWGLETTVPINHGDSGSALVNERNQVVGINCGGDDNVQSMQYAVDRNELLKFLEREEVGVNRKEVLADDVLPPASTVVQDTIKLLDDTDLERCRKGIEALSRADPFEARRAIPALVRALQRHADPGFRRRVTEELERIGPPVKEDIGCLDPAMRIAYKPLRLYVLHALEQLGADAKQAVPVLVLGLKDADGEVRQKSALVVKNLGAKARALAFAPLLKLANDEDEEVARAGLDALVKLGPLTEAEIDLLTEALGDVKRRLWVRRFAAHRLGLQGEKAAKAVPTFAKVLTAEKDFDLLSYSIAALQSIGDKRKEAGAALVSLIASPQDEKIRMAALEALEALDLAAFPTSQMLEYSITDKSQRMREAITKRLGTRLAALKPEQMTEFVPLFRHKEPAIVLAGLKLVLMKKRDAAPLSAELAGLVEHSDAKVRRMAIEALQAVGPAAKAAVPSLLKTLKEVPESQRLDVAVTLGAIESMEDKVVEAVLPPLLAGLHPRVRKSGAPTTAQINKVLAAIGQPAVEAIFKLFGTLPYRGRDNIDHRQNLFVALEALGPGCKSKENYERVKSLRDREKREGYKNVLAAAQRALKEMDPN
jgi:S1-C subfamily serine protease